MGWNILPIYGIVKRADSKIRQDTAVNRNRQAISIFRLGDDPFNAATTMLSMPNFYGAHGHDPELPVMSATFIAAGPQIREDTTIRRMRNVDVAPTIMNILGVRAHDVDGEVLREILD